ncbi:MAG TPA: histone deacetylase family protein [bacterium]|nr:histone deacetylase family protein [bacterium]
MALTVIRNREHQRHAPEWETAWQSSLAYAETPERLTAIERAIAGIPALRDAAVESVPAGVLTAVHAPAYLAHLELLTRQLHDDADYCTPQVLPGPGRLRLPDDRYAHIIAAYALDVTTPFGRQTLACAQHSAALAWTGAGCLLAGDKRAYAMCRPPGHHAERARYGGFCFINNASVAAQRLLAAGRVAIVDIDYHHGNGTQDIWYDRPEVLYVSLHADPAREFPYTSGYADETGTGAGLGCNLNMPLPKTTDDDAYLAALATGLEKVRAFAPAHVIVSLGVDAHHADPVGGMRLTDAAYPAMGNMFAELGLPLLMVQEGGYNVETIGGLVSGFLRALTLHDR